MQPFIHNNKIIALPIRALDIIFQDRFFKKIEFIGRLNGGIFNPGHKIGTDISEPLIHGQLNEIEQHPGTQALLPKFGKDRNSEPSDVPGGTETTHMQTRVSGNLFI